MLKTHQSVSALFIAAWCGIIVSMAGSQPVAATPAPASVQRLVASVTPEEAPIDLPAVPLATPEPPVAPRSEPPAILAVSRAPVPGRYVSVDAMLSAAAAVGWPVSPTLPVVARCESGVDLDYDGVKEALDTTAISPWGDRGALQINPVHALPGGMVARMGYQWDDMLSLVPNLVVGLALYHAAGGFSPWACAP